MVRERPTTSCFAVFRRAPLLAWSVVALVFALLVHGGAVLGDDLKNPPERRSKGGELTTSLRVAYADNMIGGQPVHLRNYEGMLTGPTLYVCPGHTMNVRICNNLPPEPRMAAGHAAAMSPGRQNAMSPHGFNTTNLHTHGLHVSPAGNSDNIFLEIGPGQDFAFEIKVPRNHHPGTFWYHAHKHGSVALQLASGMAGALIVQGGLDEVEAIRCARDRVFVLQQIAFDAQGKVEGDYYSTFERARAGAQVKDLRPTGRNDATTINGRLRPEIHMRPGEVQRWRLIHAGIESDVNVVLDGHVLHEIACDGIALGCMKRRGNVLLYPGYRSDVLVRASDKPGRYSLRKALPPKGLELWESFVAEQVLADVVVEGDPVTMPLPSDDDLKCLAPFKPIDDVQGQPREIKFKLHNGVGEVNGKPFDPVNGDVIALKLGTAEEWHVIAEDDKHPFHVHVNPFEVITRDAQGVIIDRLWKDTIFVTSRKPAKDAHLRIRFEKYIGRSVLHCHNLMHEDVGMMQAIDIEP